MLCAIFHNPDCLEIAMMKIRLIFHKGDLVDTPVFRFRVTSNLVGGSTHLKNISQIGNLPQLGVKRKMFETTT